ncbi:MAG: TerC family protein [Candidatus Gracilibacteria bacterium]|nr:TerC family protein [Candidatus Gracilibacteria bacterium]
MLDNIINGFTELTTIKGIIALLNIIMIDIIMSGDNAIIIGMATRNLPEKLRKKAIMVGIILATILRIILAFFAVYLLGIVGIRFAGGILLLYVVWKFYKELRNGDNNHEEAGFIKEISFASAIYTIIIADVSMSLDNVLAVAGAAHGNIVTLGIGLIFSIILMAFASNYIAKNLGKYPQIQWVGLLVILFVAIEMMINGVHQIEETISIRNLLPFIIVIISLIFVFLHQKRIITPNEKAIKIFLDKHYIKIFMGFLITIMVFINIGDIISRYIKSHDAIFLSSIFIFLLLFLELLSLTKNKKDEVI